MNWLGLSEKDMEKIKVAFASFHKIHIISDIILLGEDGGCTRIILGDNNLENKGR